MASLIVEDEAREASGIKGPWRFGYNHAVDLDLSNSGTWTTLGNGDRIWRLALRCPDALSVNFEFHEYVVPSGAKVFVLNEASEFIGGLTAQSNPGYEQLGVGQMSGERTIIEYQEPAHLTGLGRLKIGQVTHGYRDVLGFDRGFNDSGACNNNVICPEGDNWRDQIRSTAMITVNGNGVCTGTLLNNCDEDGTPYFLTANHCLSGSTPNWVFRFNYDSPTCSPSTNGPSTQTVSGSNLLANSATSDVALLQLNSTPPASYQVYYSGWDNSGIAPTSSVGIHHPRGDVKKISFDNDPAVTSTFNGAQCWRILTWEDGTTEPASSGSGLWNQDGFLIGQLFGGQANCTNNVNDNYGRFNVSFPTLAPFLGNCASMLTGYDPNFVPVDLDAAVLSISDLPVDQCNSGLITPSVTLKNNGLLTLTSITVSYMIDAGTPGQSVWTGNLQPGATTLYGLPTLFAGNGTHTITLTASDPNGQPDQDPSNDSRSRDFSIVDPGQMMTLNITLDNYGTETTWELRDDNNTVIRTGGPYQDNANGTVVSSSWCLANGCFTFRMFDAANDGICCAYGNGSFEIADAFGAVYVANNGQFTTTATENFCITNTGVDDRDPFGDVLLLPNPNDGRFTVRLPKAADEDITFELMDGLGRVVQRRALRTGTQELRIDAAELSAGTYFVQLRGNSGRTVRRMVLQH